MNFREMQEIVSKDKFFQVWVDAVSDGTMKLYRDSLATFCMAVSKTPTELLDVCKEDINKPPWEREMNNWFIEFDHYCESKANWNIETYKKRKSYVKQFFTYYQIDVPKNRRNRIDNFKRPNERVLPTKDDIKLLLDSCNSIKQKSIILTQFSSGLSNSDVVPLTVGQFKQGLDENNICTIKIRRHKTGEKVITFLSPEAVDAIKSYLKVERDNLEDNQPLFTQHKSEDKAMAEAGIVSMYERLCDDIGWDRDKNEQRKVTGHLGRQWLKTNFANSGMPREPLETIIGHKLGGTDDNYYNATESQLKSLYIKHLPSIAINPIKTLSLESEEVKAIKEENKALKQEIVELKAKTEENSKSISDIEKIKKALKASGILESEGLDNNDLLNNIKFK
jgi:integrase